MSENTPDNEPAKGLGKSKTVWTALVGAGFLQANNMTDGAIVSDVTALGDFGMIAMAAFIYLRYITSGRVDVRPKKK